MIELVVIDPGHGGDDNGAVWGYSEEDDINLSICYLLRCELEKECFQVAMTREHDKRVSLKSRVDMANDIRAELYLSIHCDAFHNTSVSGISSHVYTDPSTESLDYANRIQESMVVDFPNSKNRGIKRSNFYVLRYTNMPSVLIECEFLSNTKTRKLLKEPENQLRISKAISAAIK